MPFRQSKSLTLIPLPIAGHTLVEVDNKPSMLFTSPSGIQSRLEFWQGVLLTEPNSSGIVPGSSWGTNYDPDVACKALSSLVGQVVIAAFAHSQGNLEVRFEEGIVLEVHPDDYEAWDFQQPAPSSMKRYPKNLHYSCSGYYGGLIQFGSLPKVR